LRSAGVSFRTTPTFWGSPLGPAVEGRDRGHDVELAAYEVDEIRAIVARSREILQQAGFSISGSFRAGGWLASPSVLEAIRAEGFVVDSSATDTTWHDELTRFPVHRRIAELWPKVTVTTAPYVIDTPAGSLLEMPDTGALADYVTADEMADHIEEALTRLERDPSRDVFVHIGFHQETARRFLSRVREAIERVRAGGERPLVFETLEASAARARASLQAAGSRLDPH
jgi:hypothetical protein